MKDNSSNKNSWNSVGSGSSPHLKVVCKRIDLIEEVKSIPTDDVATHLTLQALGEDLIDLEGLRSPDDEKQEDLDGDNMVLIPLEEFEE